MWKYVSRRIKDSLERSANYFDVRSAAGVANQPNCNSTNDVQKPSFPCSWNRFQKCCNTSREYNTNGKKWYYDSLNRSWLGAITWSSALVIGWYTSQFIHLKHKYRFKKNEKCLLIQNHFYALTPAGKAAPKKRYLLDIPETSHLDDASVSPPIHLISNEKAGGVQEGDDSGSSADSNDLSDVLNSIENKLGVAAIGNGHHQEGLNMLRSAATRNHPAALFNLGICYEKGLGLSADEKMAMELFRNAAALEHPEALYNLALYYGQGRGGLSKDVDMASRLLRLAAAKGQQQAIKAIKSLGVPPVEEVKKPIGSWYSPVGVDESGVPTPTHLLVQHVNSSAFMNLGFRCDATVY